MMIRTRHSLIAGLAVLLLTNAVALGGVWWNRSGEPDSTLKLSMRELSLSRYERDDNWEDSGLSLTLNWRMQSWWNDDFSSRNHNGAGGSSPWLDEAKMASLGFDVHAKRYSRTWSTRKPVLVVLELDGPTYRQSLERARRHLANEAAAAAEIPDQKAAEKRIDTALKLFQSEERENSRLFAVDAGLDAAVLRAKYPDRDRYVIVSGVVWPIAPRKGGRSTTTGFLERINVNQINVPHAFRTHFEAKAATEARRKELSEAPFEVSVAFGQRLEPWITAINAPE